MFQIISSPHKNYRPHIYLYYIYTYQLRFCTGSIGLMFFKNLHKPTKPHLRHVLPPYAWWQRDVLKPPRAKTCHTSHIPLYRIEPIPILQGQKKSPRKNLGWSWNLSFFDPVPQVFVLLKGLGYFWEIYVNLKSEKSPSSKMFVVKCCSVAGGRFPYST